MFMLKALASHSTFDISTCNEYLAFGWLVELSYLYRTQHHTHIVDMKWWNTFRFEIEDFAFQRKYFAFLSLSLFPPFLILLARYHSHWWFDMYTILFCHVFRFCFSFSYFSPKPFISHSQRIASRLLSQNMMQIHVVTLRLFIQFLAYFRKILVTENETVSFIYHSMYRVDVDVVVAVAVSVRSSISSSFCSVSLCSNGVSNV